MADRDLTEDEVADLKEAFAMFDINGDGRLIPNGCRDASDLVNMEFSRASMLLVRNQE